MKVHTLLVLGLLAPLSAPAAGGPPDPAGPDFQVNVWTPSSQLGAAAAPLGDGGFVVAWESYGSYGDDSVDTSVQARLYDRFGAPVGNQFQVNTGTTSNEGSVAIGPSGDGGFVVAWRAVTDEGTDTDRTSIQAQVFDGDGKPIGGQFQVNSWTTGLQQWPAVGPDGAGGFVVVWESSSLAGDGDHAIAGQRFDPNGFAIGPEFQVNTYTFQTQSQPAVSPDGSGGFVVVWESFGSAGDDVDLGSIQGRRFAANGQPIGDQFQINSYTPHHQLRPSVSGGGIDGFVVAWLGASAADDSVGVRSQRFASDATPVGGEFQVNTHTPDSQRYPSVHTEAESFLVAWEGRGAGDDSDSGIHGRLYTSDGTAIGDQFQINTTTPTAQRLPTVTVDGVGRWVVVWQSNSSSGSDGSLRSIQARRYHGAVFSDGFESGDTSAWSASVP